VDTIAAIATGSGMAGVGVIRLSGPRAVEIAEACVGGPLDRTVKLRWVRDAHGAAIDRVLAFSMRAPHSFTGEDLLEVSTHGGLIVPMAVLAAAIHAGAREAQPGEFTRRAVLNGKLDVLQAEAIGDLVDARSSASHRLALSQLDGGLSQRIDALRVRILGLEALLAYDIDFPEEDDGPIPRARIETCAVELIDSLDLLIATGDQGTRHRHRGTRHNAGRNRSDAGSPRLAATTGGYCGTPTDRGRG